MRNLLRGIAKHRQANSALTALITPEQVAGVFALADQLALTLPRGKPPKRLIAGTSDTPSPGRGMEFEELRAYALGDDLRRIDWRAAARTGWPHTRLYREERQLKVEVGIDLSASMRFGTSKRLKATQAARLALLFAYVAWRENAALGFRAWGSALLSEQVRASALDALKLAELMTKFCPLPPSATESQPDWNARLTTLAAGLSGSGYVLLISDFKGLLDTHVALLRSVSAGRRALAIQILDQAEQRFPAVGQALFRPAGSALQQPLDTQNATHRQTWDAAAARRRQARQDCLARGGFDVVTCSGNDAIQDCVQRLWGSELG